MIWDQLTSAEIAACERNIPVVLLTAATEQHGPHLPLSTDRLIGEYFLKELNQKIPQQVLILPSVSVGCSDHHLPFAGSLSLPHKTFIDQVEAIISSVLHHGFQHIVIVNSHGGNQAVNQVIMENVGYQNPSSHVVVITWWKLVSEELLKISTSGAGGVGHAGEFETSLMMLIDPQSVRSDKIEPGKNQETYHWAEGDMLRSPDAHYYRTMQQMTPNGVYGDPTQASTEKGQQIAEIVVDGLARIILDLYAAPK